MKQSRFPSTSRLGLALGLGFGMLVMTGGKSLANYTQLPDAEGMHVVIPAQVDDEGTPLVYREALYHRDYSAVQHALASAGRIMRDSEMGHQDYAPELADEPMRRQGDAWLEVQAAAGTFVEPEQFVGTMVFHEGQWQPGSEMKLADLAPASFSYHMHHSAGRWSDLGLEDAIIYRPAAYLAALAARVSNDHYGQRGFQDIDEERDAAAMAHGMDALHALAYAWVRWDKPGGAEDMGKLSKERMEAVHGVTLDRLMQISRNVAGTLDDAWDEARKVYDLDNDGHYTLDEVGSLARGHKALYELLYVFGDEEDKALAKTLFERNADMLQALLSSDEVVRNWGMAERVAFTDEGVVADSGRVDTESQWRFLNHLTGGFALLRERDGTSSFLDSRPELPDQVGELSDQLLKAALAYQLDNDGLMVRRLALDDGEVNDDRHQVAAIGWFVTAAGNAYRSGSAFDRPGSWENDAELEARSRDLYEAIRHNNEWLLSLLE